MSCLEFLFTFLYLRQKDARSVKSKPRFMDILTDRSNKIEFTSDQFWSDLIILSNVRTYNYTINWRLWSLQVCHVGRFPNFPRSFTFRWSQYEDAVRLKSQWMSKWKMLFIFWKRCCFPLSTAGEWNWRRSAVIVSNYFTVRVYSISFSIGLGTLSFILVG